MGLAGHPLHPGGGGRPPPLRLITVFRLAPGPRATLGGGGLPGGLARGLPGGPLRLRLVPALAADIVGVLGALCKIVPLSPRQLAPEQEETQRPGSDKRHHHNEPGDEVAVAPAPSGVVIVIFIRHGACLLKEKSGPPGLAPIVPYHMEKQIDFFFGTH